MSENEPAQMIEGRYRIVRNIAEGGMATVYEAVDERLGRTVAIKVMHTQLAKGPHREQFVLGTVNNHLDHFEYCRMM